MESKNQEKLKVAAYTALQWTWGLPQTLAGAAMYLIHRRDDHFDYRGARATAWDRDVGVSLGKFIFVPKKHPGKTSSQSSKIKTAYGIQYNIHSGTCNAPASIADKFLLDHEYGHTLQSLILGPFYLLLVGAPSILWNRLPYFRNKRRRTGRSYYSAPFEKTANTLAAKSKSRPK